MSHANTEALSEYLHTSSVWSYLPQKIDNKEKFYSSNLLCDLSKKTEIAFI